MTLLRMRCLLCRRPWAATPAAPARCPFCGCERTIEAGEILTRAFTTAPERRRAWLFTERTH